MKKHQVKINVYGMMCQHCEATVTKALSALDGVEHVTASHESNQVTVDFYPEEADESKFGQIIEKEGYSLSPEEPSSAESSDSDQEDSVSAQPSCTAAQTDSNSVKEISFGIQGMHCANCALAVEKAFDKSAGVIKAVINLPLEKGFVVYDSNVLDDAKVLNIVRSAGYTPVDKTEETENIQGKEAYRFYLAAGITIPMMILMHGHFFSTMTTHYILFVLASVVQWVSGIAFYQGAYFSLKNRLANMDVLISLGISAAYFYSVYSLFFLEPDKPLFFDSSAMLITFILLGKMLEARAKGKTSQALKNLLSLNPDTARIIRQDGTMETIPSSMVAKGDHLQILPGERIPVDGLVLKGISAVDESMITGESIPVDKQPGAPVTGATINRSGVLVMEARHVGQDTFLANIVRMVENAQADKAPIQKFADRISNIFVPVVVIVAISVFGFWYAYPGAETDFLFAFERMIAVLVIACPCALGLATPTAIMVGSGVGLKNGILIKKGSALETISRMDILVLDKTGTLTQGTPQVTGIYPVQGKSEKELISLAAAAEANSSHPLATAIVAHAKAEGISVLPTENVTETSGQGLVCTLNNQKIQVGKPSESANIPQGISRTANDVAAQGASLVYVFLDNELAGLIALSDPVKPDAQKTIKELQKMGIKTALASGDTQACVQFAAEQTGMELFRAQMMPQEKISFVTELQDQGMVVGMAGDGINDAPALAQAHVSIAIGSGTDVARETGDLVLVKNTLMDVVKTVTLGRKTLSIIKGNFFWALFYNVLMIPIAGGIFYPAFGLVLQPEIASIAMWLSSLTVVGNSLRLYKVKL